MIIKTDFQLQNSIESISNKIVYGGLPILKTNSLSSFALNVGVPRRKQVELPCKRIRFIGFVPRFRYRLHRKFRHKLRLGLMPFTQRLNKRTSNREIRRWILVGLLRTRRWRKFFKLFNWPKVSMQKVNRKIYEISRNKVLKVYRHPTIPLGEFVKDYDWRLFRRYRRGYKSFLVYHYVQSQIATKPRWCAPSYGFGSQNNITIRRDFLRPCTSLLSLRPTETGLRKESLNSRLKRLEAKQGYIRVFKWRAKRLLKHTRWNFKKLAKAVPKKTRRYLRLSKKRVRRRVVLPFRLKKLFRRTVRSGLPKQHLHRIPLLEANHLLYPQQQNEPYLEMVTKLNRFLNGQKISTTLEYNHFRELPYDLDIKRKKTNNKVYKPKDHPVWGEVLQRNYLAKLGWLQKGHVLGLALKNRISSKIKDPNYNEINNPSNHPLQTGPWSYLFWSTVPWARGSYWRTKPIGRAKRVFIESVNGGFLQEKESRTANTAGLLSTIFRSNTTSENNLFETFEGLQVGDYLIETDMDSLDNKNKKEPLFLEPLDEDFSEVLSDSPKNLSLQSKSPFFYQRIRKKVSRLVSYLKKSNKKDQRLAFLRAWPYLFKSHHQRCFRRAKRLTFLKRVLWNFKSVFKKTVHTFYMLFFVFKTLFLSPFWLVRYVIKKFVRAVKFFFRTIVNIKNLLLEAGHESFKNAIFNKRGWRRFRWAYHAWLHVYASDNFGDEMLNPEVDVEAGNWVENEEDDLAVDYGEELESEGTYWTALNPDQWESYWNPDVDDYFDESKEIMADLLFEELPYYINLVVQPFVDFMVRLPFWGLLEGLSVFALWLKREWQLFWMRQLLKGGRLALFLVVLKRLIHALVWIFVYTTGINLVSPDELNLFITYSCGLVFYDEYYILWFALVFMFTAWLVGPHPLKEYLFNELGPENIGFITLAGIVLCTPEEYYTQRPLSDPIRLYQDRTLGHWSGKPLRKFPTQHHYRGGHGSTYTIYTYDTIQQTIANFNDLQEWAELDFTDKEPNIWLSPDRFENEDNLPGWPLTDQSSENFFWHRHPIYYRNNYMEMIQRDQWWDHDCFEPYFRDELDDSPRNEAIYHQVNTRMHSANIVTYPTVTKTEFIPRSFE